MKSKLFLFFIFITLCSSSLFADKPLSVLIIGGGPAGLATAIEARLNGCSVTVVEKREGYSRYQSLFLLDASLKLFKKWGIEIPQLEVVEIVEGVEIGFVPLNYLEERLERRAKEMGVKKVSGKFKSLRSNQATILTPEKEVLIPYDIVVGADGLHSSVRESLGIEKNCIGKAFGASALVLDPTDSSKELDISPPIKYENGFLRRIKVPAASFVFTQFPFEATKRQLEKALDSKGWSKEADALRNGKALFIENINIALQQAQTFSDEEKSALLVGEAAATASFFQGMGANTALKTAEIAGVFFKEMQIDSDKAFQNFNLAMKRTTDALIEDSAFLFK